MQFTNAGAVKWIAQRRDALVTVVARAVVSIPIVVLMAVAANGQIEFDRPKAVKPLPNPMVMAAARDDVRNAAKQLLETRSISLDKEECNQQTGDCVLVTKPVELIRGITTRS